MCWQKNNKKYLYVKFFFFFETYIVFWWRGSPISAYQSAVESGNGYPTSSWQLLKIGSGGLLIAD